MNLTWPCVLIDIASQSGLNMLQANLSQFLSSILSLHNILACDVMQPEVHMR